MSYSWLKEFHKSIVSVFKVYCGLIFTKVYGRKCYCVWCNDILYFILNVINVHTNFVSFIRWLTSKEIHVCEVPKWKKEIVEIVCVFEKEFPTSFMDLQVHLLIDLVDEIEIAGIVWTRWMFFFERYIKTLKIYVQQKARPEGCMVEGYVLNEAFFFLWKFHGKDFEDRTWFWDGQYASYIISGEKTQSSGIQVEIDK